MPYHISNMTPLLANPLSNRQYHKHPPAPLPRARLLNHQGASPQTCISLSSNTRSRLCLKFKFHRTVLSMYLGPLLGLDMNAGILELSPPFEPLSICTLQDSQGLDHMFPVERRKTRGWDVWSTFGMDHGTPFIGSRPPVHCNWQQEMCQNRRSAGRKTSRMICFNSPTATS
jgi:hypothetical protein